MVTDTSYVSTISNWLPPNKTAFHLGESGAPTMARKPLTELCSVPYKPPWQQHIMRTSETIEKVKKSIFYIAQYPVHWTAQSTLHFPTWQTCSFRNHLGFSSCVLQKQLTTNKASIMCTNYTGDVQFCCCDTSVQRQNSERIESGKDRIESKASQDVY